ncbi:MAG: aminotransferase class I/II-fold pyridoxal phosphate-dependent enzyme [Armatimonadetes bacterium]|nr:aminotransferase class I/II-fold pyridoxal phosphate-dependent enzyme [Armatimonadota bacterium]
MNRNFQDFGLGHVNPPISDSAMYEFETGAEMTEMFETGIPGRFLYGRHLSPSNQLLAEALAEMEGTEAACVTATGMSAIACILMHLCEAGDEVVASRTVYGGTYALMGNLLPKFGVKTHFVNMNDLNEVARTVSAATKVLYCETLSNPLLAAPDIRGLAKIANLHGITLIVDNTFAPMIVRPGALGAHVVVHSLTKYVNGMGDHLGGAVCASNEIIAGMLDVNNGTSMLLGPTMDAQVSASIRKNMQTLPIRMIQHSANALAVTTALQDRGYAAVYPGLESHPDHRRFASMAESKYGFGGVFTLDCGSREAADRFMQEMKRQDIGHLAVSLGFVQTLFSMPACSTSSEIPEEERDRMGLSTGFVRFSIGVEPDSVALANKIVEIAERIIPQAQRKAG